MKMFLLTYKANPKPDSSDAKKLSGAYINCWIKETKFEKADAIARSEIADSNWKIATLEEAIQVTQEYYSNDKSKHKYFEQALIDNAVFVFHTYPKRKRSN